MGERLAAEKRKRGETGAVGRVSISPEAILRQKAREVAASLAEDFLPSEGDGGLKGAFLSRLSPRAEGGEEFQQAQALLREREIGVLREKIQTRAERVLKEILG